MSQININTNRPRPDYEYDEVAPSQVSVSPTAPEDVTPAAPVRSTAPVRTRNDGMRAAVTDNLTWAIALVLVIVAIAIAFVFVVHHF